jgi:hypothetical protein
MATRTKAKSKREPSARADESPTPASKVARTAETGPASSAPQSKTTRKPRKTEAAKAAAKPAGTAAQAKPKARARRAPTGGAPARSGKRAPKQGSPPQVSPEERDRMIRDAAYYIAERNRFEGDPTQFWLEAERQVEQSLQRSVGARLG